MLKNAREYLKKEYEKKVNKIRSLYRRHEELEDLNTKYQEGKPYVDAYKDLSWKKSDLIGDSILCGGITIVLGICIVLVLHPFTLACNIAMAILLGADALKIGKSLINYNKAKKKFKETKGLLTLHGLFNKEELENAEEFERNLPKDIEFKLRMNELDISCLTKDATILWDILSSDDFEAALLRHKGSLDSINRALYEEWLGYIEEISKKPNIKAHLPEPLVENDSYKESIQKLHVKPKKLEKNPNHPLSIY